MLTQTIVIESNCTIINHQAAAFYYLYEMFLESVNCISECNLLNNGVSHKPVFAELNSFTLLR